MTPQIHPTAIVHPDAELHPTVRVGPYTIVGERVKIGPQTTIGPHVVIEGPTEIGMGNRIFPGAAIGLESQDKKYQGAESWVKIGDRNRIREYVTINRATGEGEATEIGNDNLFMAYVHVAHNCRIENSVVIANNVALGGHVEIESKAIIGGVLGVHQFVRIGQLAMVGGMTRIVRDVPPYMLVEGSPARVRSLNLVGLQRADFTSEEIGQLKKSFRMLYRSDYSFTRAVEQLYLLGDEVAESSRGEAAVQHLRDFLKSSLADGRRGPIPGSHS
ncbi:MAG: acyl-ACP--UDP-N-acetylglucosamine O-acyltransferase [Cyanobacteriota bacterium]|nr:acyl-ACP--UDP-N-acetylglucosamine O-acyltransferase [Cyanobacteriota bacterium]